MSLKNTGLAHVPKLQQPHSRSGVTRPVIKTTPREFTAKLTLGTDAEVHLSEPSSPATPGNAGNSLHSIPSFSVGRTSTPPNMCYMATIQDRDRWGPDTTSRGTFTSADLSALVGIHATKLAFLPNFSHLRHVDLGPLSSVVTIGDNFLVDCSCLNALDFSPLTGVKSIGNAFLSGCTTLSRVDLSPLALCQTVGSDFLNRCMSLGSVDLSAMSSLVSTGDGFLRGCTSMTSVALTPRLRRVGASFLAGCARLVSIDLSTLSRMTTLPSYFLSGCSALRTVDLSSMKDLAAIESYCFWGCSALLSVDCAALRNVEQIGAYFLSGCTSLGSLDLSAMGKLTRIGCGFLSGCSYLRSLNLSGIPPATEVGSHFLYGCSGLSAVDLRPLAFLENIDDCFLSGCRSLVRLDLRPLSHVRTVGHYFLSGCASLFQLDLQPMQALRSASGYFLADCSSLLSLDLTQLVHLRVRGGGMLDGCDRLTVLQVASLHQLAGIDAKFLDRMPVEVVNLNSTEAVAAIGGAANSTASGPSRCVICVEYNQHHDIRSEDDGTLPPDTARGSSRTSKSTNSGTSQVVQQSLPTASHGGDRRHGEDFAKILSFHQQKRIFSLEYSIEVMRSELETVSRRLAAFTRTAEKDMGEANQLILAQKQRIEDLERANAALSAKDGVLNGQAASSSPPGSPSNSFALRGRQLTIDAKTPHQSTRDVQVLEAGAQCSPTINIASTRPKVTLPDAKSEKQHQHDDQGVLRQSARPRSASAGGWFSWWGGRQATAEKKSSHPPKPLDAGKLEGEDSSDEGYGDV